MSKKTVKVRKTTLLVAFLASIALIVAGTLTFAMLSKDDRAEATTVTAEPANSAVNPFMPPAGTDQPDVTPPAAISTASNQTPPAQSYSGDTEGLYGGTLNNHSCDAKKMIDFFGRNPAKAAAWAGVLGIRVADISSFMSSLTPVTLRSDTYVRNHGWENGHATSFVSVLQAGTAVFVDKYGYPVVKCYCGNPLTPWHPPVSFRPRWKCGCHHPEPYWRHWGKTTVIIIERTTTIIDSFIVVDTKTGKPFTRPAGPATTDTVYTPPGSPSASASAPAPTPAPSLTDAPPPAQAAPPPPQAAPPPPPPPAPPPSPPPAPEQAPPAVTGRTALALLRNRVQECENQGVRYPWEQAVSQKDTYYQIATALRWIVTIQDTTASGSTKDFAFEVDPVAETVAPSSSWARRAAQHCPGLAR